MEKLNRKELVEIADRRLKQIQHLLVENQQLKNELETCLSYPHPTSIQDNN